MMTSNAFRIIFMGGDKGEVVASTEADLLAILAELQSQEYPRSINILSPNGDILTVALGSKFGFVQHEDAASASPHYLMAVDRSMGPGRGGFQEVDAGGTPTPIPDFACLSPARVVEIVIGYARSLRLPSSTEWKEV